MIMPKQRSGRRIGAAYGNGHATFGQPCQNLMQCFLTRGIHIIHRLRIQHKPFDGCGGLYDQFFYLFLKYVGVGEIE